MGQQDEALRSLQAALRISRGHIDEEAQRGNCHTLDVTVQSHIPVLTFRYVRTTIPMPLIEAEIHHFWNTVIKAAKHWDASNPKHDTLVRYLLSARSMGTLKRPQPTLEGETPEANQSDQQEIIICSDGSKFWSDLPFLSQDLVEEWTQRFYTAEYDGENNLRSNLASFVGRLISVGVWNGPAVCALSLFRETLETSRPVVQALDASSSQKETNFNVQTLLCALQQMLYYSEERIIDLSNNSHNIADSTVAQDISGLGELAVQSGLSSSGYYPDRWHFWVQRLENLAKSELSGASDSAECCLDVMRSAAKNIQGPLASRLDS
ncbi:hypothetical protein FLONG3_2846 [Fusarium longipes]|uniref:Uncharacterized protein n=1 Tax=Fusarium longipes TaxID=694270 RepID=A0A395T2P5_9HYPO|nr:hypothetical protein FLONG3_2846 [Fusarium longipes]